MPKRTTTPRPAKPRVHKTADTEQPLLEVPGPVEVVRVRPVDEGQAGHGYTFAGDVERYFPSIGVTLTPGQKVTLDGTVEDTLLVPDKE